MIYFHMQISSMLSYQIIKLTDLMKYGSNLRNANLMNSTTVIPVIQNLRRKIPDSMSVSVNTSESEEIAALFIPTIYCT